MPVFRLVILCVVSSVFGDAFRICGNVRRPPIEGSASSKVTSESASTSTTAHAVVSVVSLYAIHVYDFILPICVFKVAYCLRLLGVGLLGVGFFFVDGGCMMLDLLCSFLLC
jgi:hypothetical protein